MNDGHPGRWFDIRAGEGRAVAQSACGAFLVVSILILGRSLREAAFLSIFEIDKLPYMTGAVALISFPLIAGITRLSKRWRTLFVLRALIGIQAAGLASFVPVVRRGAVGGQTTVLFYLWTALGSLLIASAFWLVVSETFALRGAKRLFGLISAGGTVGALVTGFGLKALSARVGDPLQFVTALIGFLVLLLCLAAFWPPPPEGVSRVLEAARPRRRSGGLALILESRHLRLIAVLVMAATLASTLLDYQFKEAVRAAHADAPAPDAALAGFFGAFYAWVGAAALLIQLSAAGRLIASFGIGKVLLVLPVLLMIGSLAFGLWPLLIVVTVLKGSDASLRKSLFRPLIEILYLPVDLSVRRRTKALIDTALDTLAEGLGAGFILLWVAVWGLPSRFLSLFVFGIAAGFIVLSRRMDRQYLHTVVSRLHEEEKLAVGRLGDGTENLLSAGFSMLGIDSMLADSPARDRAAADLGPETDPKLGMLRSADPGEVRRGLQDEGPWSERHLEALIDLLARAPLVADARTKLADLGELAVPSLLRTLLDEMSDEVVRRRIPWFLSSRGGSEVDDALLLMLEARHFELRYRVAVALTQRRKRGLWSADESVDRRIWQAIRTEITRARYVWELQALKDDIDAEDEFILDLAETRGRRSLEHTFRLMSLVLDPEHVRAAYRGIVMNDTKLRNFALEYLEQVLPLKIRQRLLALVGDARWPSAGGAARPFETVVGDLVTSSRSLFVERDAGPGPEKDRRDDSGAPPE